MMIMQLRSAFTSNIKTVDHDEEGTKKREQLGF